MKFLIFLCLIVFALAQTTPEYRSIDGTGNNKANPTWGSQGIPLERKMPIRYANGFSTPTGGLNSNLLSPRAISNAIAGRTPEQNIPSELSNSILTTFWAQLMDHDITFSPNFKDTTGQCLVHFDIDIPKGDFFFDSEGVGGKKMEFCRAINITGSGTNASNPLKFANRISAWIDATMVYGNTDARAKALRSFKDGLLNTSAGLDGDYLPLNDNGQGGVIITMGNAVIKFPDTKLFMAGDPRANENPILLSLHTMLVREHNRMARLLPAKMTDEEKYQQARKMLIAFVQKITYEDFLPTILGTTLPKYTGYKSDVNPNIFEFFSTAAYRFGHDQLTNVILRLDPLGKSIKEGPALLRDVFFDMDAFKKVGASAYLRGASVNPQRIIDSVLEDDVRVFLFGKGPASALDLVARNIQRARDIGMGFYNEARKAYNLPTCDTFACVNDNPEIVTILNNLYGKDNVTFLDCFVGGLLEKKANSKSKLGLLFATAISDQFQRIRDGDRFWYQNPGVLTKAELKEVEGTKISDIMLRTTDSKVVPVDAFNRRNVPPEQVFNPQENTKWIIAIIVLTIVAGICIIVIIGLCFAKSNSRKVDDNQLYDKLTDNHN